MTLRYEPLRYLYTEMAARSRDQEIWCFVRDSSFKVARNQIRVRPGEKVPVGSIACEQTYCFRER